MRWDHVTDYVGILAERVVDYSVSADGQKILLLRTQQITAGGVEKFNLELLTLDTMQITPLWGDIPRLAAISLSPDGQWAAVISGERPQITLISMNGTAPDRQIGPCIADASAPCTELSWSPNSQQLLWSDAAGVWLASLPSLAPRQILDNQVKLTDPRGNSLALGIRLSNYRWSPAGRFVLGTVQPLSSEVFWTAVLDTLTGRLIELPDTYSYNNIPASLAWLQDGNLVEAYGGSTALRSTPVLKIWQILPTRNELIYHSKTYPLQSRDFPLLPSLAEASVSYQLSWIYQTSVSELAFAMSLPGLQTPPVLFVMDLQHGLLTKLQEIPFPLGEVLWCPDGSGALIVGFDGQILFASTAEKQLRTLNNLFGLNPTRFHWLPPTPRR